MEKNTVLAIILSAVIITGGMMLTQVVNEKNTPETPVRTESAQETEVAAAETETVNESVEPGKAQTENGSVSDTELANQSFEVETFNVETDNYHITFDTRGGIVSDLLLKKELDSGKRISMVLEGDEKVGTFNIAFGDVDAPYLTSVFGHENLSSGDEIIHRFYRDFEANGQVFTLSKTYRILPGEYVIELIISMETPDGKAVPLGDSSEPAYTLTYGPQIGPEFTKLDGRNEIREYVSWGPSERNGRLTRDVHRNRSKFVQTGQTVNWAGVVGKYFGVMVSPGSGSATFTWDGRSADGMNEPSRLQITRPARRSAELTDTYQFYVGPLNTANLERYNDASTNKFGLSGMGFTNAPRTSSWLGWLEAILKVLLEWFYVLIPNYGVAIILLTVLIKVILYPFTHNSYESTSKMQSLQPKIKELQAQYKDEPQKLNAKTAELYKEEGVNPMGGCLPMVLQMPVFFALYGLLNKYFPLRGAEFIPGWITDLSAPEYIWREFQNPINLLIIDIPAIRILPVIYLAGQLLMTKVTQQGTAGQAGAQQKMLTLGMPIMFFFILYNMPSGLLLYWTSMNLITIGQQLVTNWFKKRKAAGGTA